MVLASIRATPRAENIARTEWNKGPSRDWTPHQQGVKKLATLRSWIWSITGYTSTNKWIQDSPLFSGTFVVAMAASFVTALCAWGTTASVLWLQPIWFRFASVRSGALKARQCWSEKRETLWPLKTKPRWKTQTPWKTKRMGWRKTTSNRFYVGPARRDIILRAPVSGTKNTDRMRLLGTHALFVGRNTCNYQFVQGWG